MLLSGCKVSMVDGRAASFRQKGSLMAHFADLEQCTYFGDGLKVKLLAIGWMERDHPYAKGDVDIDFFARLCELLQNPWWNGAMAAGVHLCSFCRFSGGLSANRFQVGQRGVTVPSIGNANLVVPGKGCYYAAPSTIVHYIDAHEYAPPPEFVEAVMACPPMRSMEYLRLVTELAAEWKS